MRFGRRIIGAAAGAAGVAVAGAAAARVAQRRLQHRRDAGESVRPGSLHSAPITVVADDGVPLHAEVDEYDGSLSGPRAEAGAPPLTVVFVHGYALNLDCWHYQRAAWRGLVRTVYYDQRSHGRSGRAEPDSCTIEQLGRDLKRVLDDLTNDEPVVLVGHSMGGMTIMALAEQHPELFGSKIGGAALISTTAGGLDPGRILFPMLPAGFGPGIVTRVIRAMSRGHKAVDAVRTLGTDVAMVVTDRFAFGDRDVPAGYLEFAYQMLAETPFRVVADFYPLFATLDKWDAAPALSTVPTAIICGTSDKLTSIGHSRKLHAQILGSDLLECEDAGHMVIIERHQDVNAELEQLLDRAWQELGE